MIKDMGKLRAGANIKVVTNIDVAKETIKVRPRFMSSQKAT
jgi:hypothetical protein